MLQHNRWNSLPDDIIGKIISDLKFPRGGTVNITTTDFNVKLLIPVEYNISEFWNILDNLFTLFTTPCMNTFSIDLGRSLYLEPCVKPILDSWARRLRACNTQHIAMLGYSTLGERVCPPSFFQIQSLVSLHLSSLLFVKHSNRFVSHPIILPNLEKLSLGSVDYEFLGRILSSCPLLVYLCFSLYVKPKGKIRSVSISSKSLNRLRITTDMSSVLEDIIDVVINAPILENLSIIANSSSFVSMRTFDSILNLKSLLLDGGLTTKLFNSPTGIIFPNLTNLTLFEINSFDLLMATSKQQMLHCPNLKVLVLQFSTMYDIVWDTKAISFVLVEHVNHLKLIMGTVRIDQQTLNLVTWLLTSAPVLNKLVISGCGTRPSDDSLSKFRKTLLECAEETSRCQIKFLGGYKLE
ncbi:putative F-box/FBD/LRR-repeat protein At1g78760 [Silene latifolia]|uniref:putative F-box/FBD/LRR-repeat protein At1g78760 n=1 Tax=Silene latifolia TaxID=37657 RepID=UPI003D787761